METVVSGLFMVTLITFLDGFRNFGHVSLWQQHPDPLGACSCELQMPDLRGNQAGSLWRLPHRLALGRSFREGVRLPFLKSDYLGCCQAASPKLHHAENRRCCRQEGPSTAARLKRSGIRGNGSVPQGVPRGPT